VEKPIPWHDGPEVIVEPSQMQLLDLTILHEMKFAMDAWRRRQLADSTKFLANMSQYPKTKKSDSAVSSFVGNWFSQFFEFFSAFFVHRDTSAPPPSDMESFWAAFYPPPSNTEEIRLSAPLPQKCRLFTGEGANGCFLDKVLRRMSPGETTTIGAPISTSWHPNVALAFADTSVVVLDFDLIANESLADPLPTGFSPVVKGIMIYEVQLHRRDAGELEILLQPGVVIKLVSVKDKMVLRRTSVNRVASLQRARSDKKVKPVSPDERQSEFEEIHRVYYCKIVGGCNEVNLLACQSLH
jgi:hypothetical protein